MAALLLDYPLNNRRRESIGQLERHSPNSFEPMMSPALVISTLGGKMRGGAGVGYAW